MSVTAAIRKMLAAGLTVEQALIASEAFESETPKDSQAERRRAKDRERKRLRNSAESAESVESAENPSPKEKSPTPSKEITPSTVSEATASSTEVRAGFAEFWILFPNKVGKRDAEREFGLALKRSSFADIMAGLHRYVAKTDDRPWCNPSTFLHQNRWDDQPAAAAPRGQGPPKPQTLGEMFREDARQQGIIPHEQPTSTPDRRLVDSDGSRQDGGSGIARRFAITGNEFGRLG